MSGHVAKQRVDWKLDGALARFPRLLNDTVTANPELFLPVFLLLVWQASAISVKPATLGLALVLTFILLIYAYRVLGTTPWLRRLGWVAPRAKVLALWRYCRRCRKRCRMGHCPTISSVARWRSTAKCIAARELIRPSTGGDALSRSALLGDLRTSPPPRCFQIGRQCNNGPAHRCLFRSRSH